MEREFIDTTLPVNLPLLFKSRAEICPDLTAQASKDKHGVFRSYSFKTIYEEILSFALALKSIGITKGTHTALISDNRKEWLIADFALLSLGAVDVPRGCDSSAAELQYIISFADCSYGIFENMAQLDKVLQQKPPLLKTAVVFEDLAYDEIDRGVCAGLHVYDYRSLMSRGKKMGHARRAEIEKNMNDIQGSDLATIIFTSGTTNIPKGVMLTHRNYMAQLEVVGRVLTVKPGDMWLSVLPVWHSFERVIQYIAITLKSGIAYSKPASGIMMADLEVIKPQWMCGVPRLWEAFANGVWRAVRKEGGLSLALFTFFIGVGKRFAWAKEHISGRVCSYVQKSRARDFCVGIFPYMALLPLYALGDIFVYRKIKKKLGGRLTAAISGGGALPPDIDDFYRAINLTLLEGYGITEAAPVLSVRDCVKPRPGCVGIVYPSASISIRDETDTSIELPPGHRGLIFARGEQIMKGYYKRPDLTAEIIDKDGWLNTGDLGMLSLDNEIKITGRAKDTIVLSGGENIEPMGLEKALIASAYIESAFVTGHDRRYLGALIVPNKDALCAFASEHMLFYLDYNDLLQNPLVHKLIQREIKHRIHISTGFRPCEYIYSFELLPDSFEIGRELSIKQEIMRHKITELYQDRIDKLFTK
ncbi:AMP-binding protein [Treponema sp. HNW]|uniref:AMP-dependent synthetase/ligase n=1 Tax=Treponema sp. HNW TaxID=3116654 RepID=UPI003D09802A